MMKRGYLVLLVACLAAAAALSAVAARQEEGETAADATTTVRSGAADAAAAVGGGGDGGVKAATSWTADTYPNPQRDVKACGRRGVRSMICDPDGVLSYDEANLAEGLIAQIARGEPPYAKAACAGGAGGEGGFQVAVALMKRMRVPARQTEAEAAAAMAHALHDSWGVGSAACDDGVLLLLSTRDRQVFVSTGAGAERAGLDAAAIARVLDNAKPALRAARYGDAVLEALHEAGLALAGAELPDGGDGDGDGGDLGIFAFFAAVVCSVWGWGWWSNRKREQRYKTCQQRLEAIKRDQAALRRGQYQASSCPVCFEDFEDGEQGGGGGGGVGAAGATDAAAGGASTSGGAAAAAESAPLLDRSGSKAAGAGAAAPSGSAAGGAAAAPKRKPLVLPCGHSFCSPCLDQWTRGGHNTCPVCRREIDGDDGGAQRGGGAGPSSCAAEGGATTAQQRRQQQQQQQQERDAGYDALWLPELAFRTRRLGLLYPDLIPPSSAEQLARDLEDGRDLSRAALAGFDARHPAREAARRAEMRDEGRMGASASFGGGGHSGGGGGGSSW